MTVPRRPTRPAAACACWTSADPRLSDERRPRRLVGDRRAPERHFDAAADADALASCWAYVFAYCGINSSIRAM
jgi:hypothetical protein